jgi:hypothetical protein
VDEGDTVGDGVDWQDEVGGTSWASNRGCGGASDLRGGECLVSLRRRGQLLDDRVRALGL